MSITDRLATLELKANLIADEQVGFLDIASEVHDRVAVLSGEVQTEQQQQIAEALALEVEGVDRVRSELRVVPREPDQAVPGENADAHMGYGPTEGSVGDTTFAIAGEYAGPGPGMATSEQFPGQFTDGQIEAEVRHKLGSHPEIDTSGVELNCDNQIVHLAGTVATADEADLLQDIVLNVRGVMGVTLELTPREGEIGTPTE